MYRAASDKRSTSVLGSGHHLGVASCYSNNQLVGSTVALRVRELTSGIFSAVTSSCRLQASFQVHDPEQDPDIAKTRA